MSPTAIPKAETLDRLPPLPRVDPRPEIRSLLAQIGRKVAVLDDDQTGTQTVHDVPIITRWDVDQLAAKIVG